MNDKDFRYKINKLVEKPTADRTAFWVELAKNITEDYSDGQPYMGNSIQSPKETELDYIFAGFYHVNEKFGLEILQQLYAFCCVLPSEMLLAAQYLANGCEPSVVTELANNGKFECNPYPALIETENRASH